MKGHVRVLDTLFLSTTLTLTAMCSLYPTEAADTVSESTTTTQSTVPTGDSTIIQHIDSKMEPTVVQSRTTTDPATGEKEKVVEPLIMERHDKVLDTTIIQPEVKETTTTTQQVLQSKQTHTVPVVAPPKHKVMRLVHRHIASRPVHKQHIAMKRKAAPLVAVKRTTESSATEISQTTEVTRQPVMKETFIKGAPENSPPPEPQVVQKTEVK
jgi:hypothetical protein